MTSFRTESDSLGKVNVPADALWGSATQRAIDNFAISARHFPKNYIKNLALIKRYAAEVNSKLGLIDKRITDAIISAAREVIEGKYDDQFPLDIFQTGSGTSTNMNMNEVLANIANLSLGGKLGIYDPVHPNDHVNMGQSSNDVMPSALHVSASEAVRMKLMPALEVLCKSLLGKAKEFNDILKIGRTHMTDAMPIRLGQEFGGWAEQIDKGLKTLAEANSSLSELALGGTAVGTEVGAHPDFATFVCKKLSTELDVHYEPAKNHFEALSSRFPSMRLSCALKLISVSLIRIADDIRLLSSGPRLGLGEIKLPSLQPGSSIMPGKVNPVIPEMVCQVATQVIANDSAITIASQAGHLELNTQLPIIASNLLESIDILANAASAFAERCIDGIVANEERCAQNVDKSLALATALVPKVGYAKATEIAKKAHKSGKTIKEIALQENVASESEIDSLLDMRNLTLT